MSIYYELTTPLGAGTRPPSTPLRLQPSYMETIYFSRQADVPRNRPFPLLLTQKHLHDAWIDDGMHGHVH